MKTAIYFLVSLMFLTSCQLKTHEEVRSTQVRNKSLASLGNIKGNDTLDSKSIPHGQGVLPLSAEDRYYNWDAMGELFVKKGGNIKHFDAVKCFVQNYGDYKFNMSPVTREGKSTYLYDVYKQRCQSLTTESGKIELTKSKVLIVDYQKSSHQPRVWVLDFDNFKVSSPMRCAHGRSNAVSRFVSKDENFKNSINYLNKTSNNLGSNATSSGFFITGHTYSGSFGKSLILHGLEQGINDNACQRSIVLHHDTLLDSTKKLYITNDKVGRMSNGCVVCSTESRDQIIDHLAAVGKDGQASTGGLVYIAGPDEKSMYYKDICNRWNKP